MLASEDKQVVQSALQALLAFVRRNGNAQNRWAGYPPLTNRLACLVQGWGGKAEVRVQLKELMLFLLQCKQG